MPVTELPAAQVFKTFVEDFGITREGRATRNPWQKDALPKEITDAPVEWYIYNIGPIKQIINAGSMGQYILFPPSEGQAYSKPIEIRRYMIDWADQGDYKQKPIIMDGADVAREWVTPNGEKGNTDLRNWGVFASRHNPPKPEEIAQAEALLRVTLDRLIAQADALYADPTKRGQITDVYRTAARIRHAERPWCAESKPMGRCDGCGRGVELDIAKCSCGAILNWEKARKLRLVSKEEYDEAVAEGLASAASPAKRVSGEKAPSKA
jgi:hypothetical protein